tara:strand:- start:1154 stop:1924 length:771 start_codon:yes stop_codon:yes gene_type:complete
MSLKKKLSNFLNKILNIFDLRIVYNRDHIFNHNDFEIENIKISKMYSMTGEKRMSYLTKAINYIFQNKINGDFVECGVWQGGNLILMQRLLDYYNENRNIYGYDTFEGMTVPNENDIDINNKDASNLMQNENKIENADIQNIWCYSSLDTVKKNLREYSKKNNLKLIKGDVNISLKDTRNLPEKISLLRLDTDFYDSTKIELETLFPLVVKNGVIIIDDYGHWKGQKKAVDEYMNKNKISPFLFEVDYSCRIFIKN